MNSKLLAFQVAKPVTPASPVECSYDPSSQTTVWVGNGKAAAYLFCTKLGIGFHGWSHCNGYGNYCNTWGTYQLSGWICDSG